MQTDLTTLLAERDAQKHKAELEKLREENQRLLQQVSDRIDLAKAEITESAIEKTMAVLNHTRTWLLAIVSALAVTLAVIGFVGVSGLTRQLTTYYTDTIHNWLRFDDANSGSHKVLDDLRTSALLDSLSLRYERNKGRNIFSQPDINDAERQRLMAIILNPSADDAQFRDALHLLIASRGMFGLVREDETGKKIVDILKNDKYSNDKRAVVLETMSNERSLFPVALQILNDTTGRNDESILMDAFANVRQFDEQRARRFAEDNLDVFKSSHNRVELAKFLIAIGADSTNIDRLLADLRRQQAQQYEDFVWNGYYQELIFARIEHGLKAAAPDVPALARFISTQMDKGLQLALSDFSNGKPYLHFFLDKTSSAVKQPESLFGNAALVDAIVKAQPLTAGRLQKVSDFFQTTDRGLWVTTLMMTPAATTQLILADGRKAQGDEILDRVWLRVEEKAGQPALIASWREKTGSVHEGIVTDIVNGEQAHFLVDFNSWQLSNYTWKTDPIEELY